AGAKEIYVSKSTGSNKNPGTKEEPQKLLWKVLGKLEAGDVVRVAAGTYVGKGKSGVMPKVEVSNVTIEGGWNADFSERDPFKHLTIITAPADRQGAGGTVFHIEPKDKPAGNCTLDGFCIDRGPGNYYSGAAEYGPNKPIEGHADTTCWGYQALNKKKSGSDTTVIVIGRGGGFTVRNMVLINNPWWGIYVKGGGEGECRIENNLVLGAQSRGIEAITGGGWGKPQWIIRNNTILRVATFGTDGRGLSVDPRKGYGSYSIEHNVIAFCYEGGMTTKFEPGGEGLEINNNLFYACRGGDLNVGGKPRCKSDEFEDELDCDNEDNVHELPVAISKIDKAWFARQTQKKTFVNDPWTTPEELVAMRAAVGLTEWNIHGFDPISAVADLPDSGPNYTLSRYPHPMKKGEEMDWGTVTPIIGVDGARGIQAFKP
ncbi:MAG: right-handed parallel beta-helix repeat-containing protein, partial [Planctomycetota bacterium]